MRKTMVICVSLTMMQGCGSSMLSDRATNPIVIDAYRKAWIGTDTDMGVISTTAGRRSIFVMYPDKDVRFCAEPPPDAIDAYSNVLSAGLKAGEQGSADFSRGMAVNSSLGLWRSQGLQYVRDARMFYCPFLYSPNPDVRQAAITQIAQAESTGRTLIAVELASRAKDLNQFVAVVAPALNAVAGGNPAEVPTPTALGNDTTQTQGKPTPPTAGTGQTHAPSHQRGETGSSGK